MYVSLLVLTGDHKLTVNVVASITVVDYKIT